MQGGAPSLLKQKLSFDVGPKLPPDHFIKKDVENYSDDDNSSKSTIITSQKYDDSYIVQCSECGLKYKLNKNDNILDYECDSCGGPLRYLDENMNQEVDRYLEERKNEAPETVYEETDSADEYNNTYTFCYT